MTHAPIPANEAQRLEALRDYAILDTGPEARFDDIARIAARAFEVPIALVSLVDEARQWTKAGVGMEPGSDVDRDIAFCSHAIMADELFVVEDAPADERFAENPLVTGEAHIRFYAGAPLRVPSGHRLGTVCVVDTQPRPLQRSDAEILEALSRQVVELFEMRKVADRLARALERVRALGEMIPICSHCRQVRDDADYWSSLERFIATRTGSRFTHGICPSCVKAHYPEQADAVLSDHDD